MGKILLGNIGNVRRLQEQIVPAHAIETGTTSKETLYNPGDYAVVENKLKRVTKEIGVGGTFDSSNTTDTNIATELGSINRNATNLQRQIVPTASIESTIIASQAYAVGDYVVVAGYLRVVTATINKGDIINNSNSTIAYVGDRLTELEKSSYTELTDKDILNTKAVKKLYLRVWRKGWVYCGHIDFHVDANNETSGGFPFENVDICYFPFDVKSLISDRAWDINGKYSMDFSIVGRYVSIRYVNGYLPKDSQLNPYQFMYDFTLI